MRETNENRITTAENNDQEEVFIHPMIPVPQALRKVLTETAAVMMMNNEQSTTINTNIHDDGNSASNYYVETFTLSSYSCGYSLDHVDDDNQENNNNNKNINKESRYSSQSLIGRVSAQDIFAPVPGYPPYHASIMDGYAIDITQRDTLPLLSSNTNTNADASSQMISFQVIASIYAGDTDHETKVTPSTIHDHNDNSNLESTTSTSTCNFIGKAIYVTTGAPIPSSFNAVIPIEDVNVVHFSENNHSNNSTPTTTNIVEIPFNVLQTATKNQWIRPIGCDIPPNTKLLSKGQIIENVHLSLLIQSRVHSIQVKRLPKVGILSTGNELLHHYDYYSLYHHNNSHKDTNTTKIPNSLQFRIPDANRPLLFSLLSSWHNSCQLFDLGIVNDDDIYHIEQVLRKAIVTCDVILTTGGISMGEKDVMESILEHRFKDLNSAVHFGRLHMKPGKPTTFATVDKVDHSKSSSSSSNSSNNNYVRSKHGKCLIFALPGNPVSAYVCTHLLVRPCLDMMNLGIQLPQQMNNTTTFPISYIVQNASIHGELQAKLTTKVKLDIERPEYHRVKLSYKPNYNNGSLVTEGMFLASSTGVQRSSRLLSLCEADGLMILPQGIQGGKIFAEIDEIYPVLLLDRGGGNVFNQVSVKESMHLGLANIAIGLVQITSPSAATVTSERKIIPFQNIEDLVIDSLSSDTGVLLVQSIRTSQVSHLKRMILHSNSLSDCLDVIIVVCNGTSFQTNMTVSSTLRSMLENEANSKLLEAVSLEIRSAAAREMSLAALFEPVIGYLNHNENGHRKSCLIIGLSAEGLESGLKSISKLLRYALSIARGQ